MTIHQVRGIIVLFIIILSAMIYAAATAKPKNMELEQAQAAYQIEKWQLKRETLHRDAMLVFYGTIGVLTSLCLSFLIVAGGIARAKNKAASVFTAHIGQHSTIPVHSQDLQRLYPIAINLSLAEIEASISSSHDYAYQISRQMIEDLTTYTRTIASRSGTLPDHTALGLGHTALPTLPLFSTPAFAELLRSGMLAPGKPLVFGFSHNSPLEGGRGVSPQYRDLRDLKSVAVAGWQGSGKTRSMAYLIAASLLAEGVRVYVIDPHKHHAEGLYALIQPLEQTGQVTVINPFDTSTLIQQLHQTLDRRLNGQEPSEPGILLVIDELARLARMDYFDELVTLLERCTQETRKANITFIGGSHKWTARHFKGRADIRGCMNSMLIHKTKPSQADLLLEDAQDKKLVKHLQQPGDAILVTDYAPPVVVTMPFCSRPDMEIVAEMVAGVKMGGPSAPATILNWSQQDRPTSQPQQRRTRRSQPKIQEEDHDVIPLAQHRKKLTDPTQLTVELIKEQIRLRKQQNSKFTQTELARQVGMSPSVLSNILNGRRKLKGYERHKLHEILFGQPVVTNHRVG